MDDSRADRTPKDTGATPLPPAGADPGDPAAAARTLWAARQPILRRNLDLAGYEILFRGGPENRFDGTDADIASVATIEQSATAFGLHAIVGDRCAFLNLSRRALLSGFPRLVPPNRCVIELLESVTPDAEVLDACRALGAEGYTLALDDYAFDPAADPLLDVVAMVKVDLRMAGGWDDPARLEPLHRRQLRLLAEKVETHDEHAAAVKAGYELFQGYFFCRPQMIETRDLPPSKLTALRFMAEMSREDAPIERLEEIFRGDPALTMRLLRYLNSAAFGWRHEIASVRQALLVMGQRPLRQWAMMIGLLAMGSDRPRELPLTALTRARFAERIAPTTGLGEHGHELFLGGMLSLVDAMVGRPLPEVLSGLALHRRVKDALLEHRGPLAPALDLVAAWQRGDWARVDAARRDCPVPYPDLGAAYADSLQWAEALTPA